MIGDLTRPEELVLAALARRPRGMASRREAARSCSISPTSASKAVVGLLAREFVTETPTTLALGRARTVNLLRANHRHPGWAEILGQLRGVELPVVDRATDRPPAWVRHAFWNADAETYRGLAVMKDGSFLAARALTTLDLELLGWAVVSLPADAWLDAASTRGLPKPAQRMALNFAEAAETRRSTGRGRG